MFSGWIIIRDEVICTRETKPDIIKLIWIILVIAKHIIMLAETKICDTLICYDFSGIYHLI